MKTASLLLVLTALAITGCGSDGGDSSQDDFDTLQEASRFSDQASEQATLAIAALQKADVEAARAHIAEAEQLANEGQDQLGGIDSEPVRKVFTNISQLTLEGYRVLNSGIEAAARGDDGATDRYIRLSLDIRKRKLQLFNRTDFEAIGVGESNEKIRDAMMEQLQSAAEQ
jgi:hypothetical protein